MEHTENALAKGKILVKPSLGRWLSHLRHRLYLYPPPEPMPHTRSFWVATGVVTLVISAFSAFFITYLTLRHDAYLTHAEDLGIMDQAIWNTLHGHLLQQTICNSIGDTNCYNVTGISRFAIHFEPILFLVSLFYFIAPTPKTLLVLQTLVVASGAFPAFWLARLRLRSEWAGVALAILYLLYPAQQQATIFDFHAVTFTTALLLFMLYFLYMRRTLWLFVFALLAMACKEEIPVVVALFGLWSLLFQHRWRSGIGLIVLALAWTGIGLFIIHLASPTGHSLLSSRYAHLGSSPLQIVRTLLFHPIEIFRQYVLEHAHIFYLRILLSPMGYLPLLAPWVLPLALPSLALNLLSSDVQMYSGLFQYNAEIVPISIFATIESLRVIIRFAPRLLQQSVLTLRGKGKHREKLYFRDNIDTSAYTYDGYARQGIQQGLLVILVAYLLFSTIRSDYVYGSMPFSQGFQWPRNSTHAKMAQSFVARIPQSASVSAQSSLAPHISHRAKIYLFPYADTTTDYVFLDVTSDIYPFYSSSDYIREAKNVLLSGFYGVIEAHDGYLLLKRGAQPPGVSSFSSVQPRSSFDPKFVLPNLPPRFCSYTTTSQHNVPHPVRIAFQKRASTSSTMELIGFNVKAASPFSTSTDYLSVTTYWHVLAPTGMPLQIVLLITDKYGREHFVSTDVPSLLWCQTNAWKPGMEVRLTSQVLNLRENHIPLGLAHLALAIVPLLQPMQKIMDVQARLPLHVISVPQTVTATQGVNRLQLMSLTLAA